MATGKQNIAQATSEPAVKWYQRIARGIAIAWATIAHWCESNLIELTITVLLIYPVKKVIIDLFVDEEISETLTTAFCYAAAAGIAWVLQTLAQRWFAKAISKGWNRFSESDSGKLRDERQAAAAALIAAAVRLPKLVTGARSELRKTAPQLEKALEVVSGGGLPLFEAVQQLQQNVDVDLAQTFFMDHASLAKRGCLLLTMPGYLRFLQRILIQGESRLICVNKTLPLDWFAAVADGDDFLPGYTSLACAYRRQITRITLTKSKTDLGNQFQAAMTRLGDPLGDGDRRARWLLSLALPLLVTRAETDLERKAREHTIDVLVERVPTLTEELTEVAKAVYSAEVPSLTHINPSPGRRISALMTARPDYNENVNSYLDEVQGNEGVGRHWSESINAAFGHLMGRAGSYWGVRSNVAEMVKNSSLEELVDSHSEAGVFKLRSKKVAFHARGDLYAGVVIRILDRADEMEEKLQEVVQFADRSPSAVLGVFGANP